VARPFLTFAAGLTGAGLLAIAGWHWATHWAPSIDRYPLQGIDLPERPPEAIEWGTVRAAGADFAYLVATSGADRRPSAFGAHWEALPAAGLRRGAVHLFSLCQPATAQANAFNTVVPRVADALPAVVDLAYRDDCAARPERGALVAEIRRFAALVEAHTGHPVILRVPRDVERDYGITAAIDRPVWAMANVFAPGYPARDWRLWRASDMRRIDGIEGPVNWDVVAQ
jgi:lysozyme